MMVRLLAQDLHVPFSLFCLHRKHVCVLEVSLVFKSRGVSYLSCLFKYGERAKHHPFLPWEISFPLVSYNIHVLVAILKMRLFQKNTFLISEFYGICHHLLTLSILSSV